MTIAARVKRAGISACIFYALILAQYAFALNVAGVKIDETAKFGNQDLKLNGAGIRYKVIFKVYAAAFYLADKKTLCRMCWRLLPARGESSWSCCAVSAAKISAVPLWLASRIMWTGWKNRRLSTNC